MSEQLEITCERGLGHMLDGRCAVRWREANGKTSGVSAKRLGALQQSRCAGCPYGEQRSAGGAHLKRDPGGRHSERGDGLVALSGEQLRARLLARAAPAAPPPPPPAAPAEPELVADQVADQVEPEDVGGDDTEGRLPGAPLPQHELARRAIEQRLSVPPEGQEERMPDQRKGLKCKVCGGKYDAKATGKIAVVCSAECRKQMAAARTKGRGRGKVHAVTALAPSLPRPRSSSTSITVAPRNAFERARCRVEVRRGLVELLGQLTADEQLEALADAAAELGLELA